MNLDPLIDAVIDLVGFLDLSGDDVVDPDAAVAAMESVRFRDFDDELRRAFLRRLEQRLDEGDEWRTEWLQFLRDLPQASGLVEGE